MSWMRWYLTGMAIMIAMDGSSLPSQAQQFQPLTNVEELDLEYDWFRPLYREDFAEGRDAKTGVFFTYDRAYMNVSRRHEAIDNLVYEIRPFSNNPFQGGPVSGALTAENSTNFSGDWTYGNRFELGYMQENNTGWLFTAWKVDNPNVRIVEDNVRRNETVVTVDREGNETVTTNVVQALDFGLDPIGNTFITLNGFNYYSFDLSRTWRLKPLHSGMVLEPLLGAKYVRIRDHSDRADYVQDYSAPLSFGPPNGSDLVFAGVSDFDAYVSEYVYTDNDMLGGQFGLRSFIRRGRWTITSEVRGFTLHNWRNRERRVTAELNENDILHNFDDTGALTTFSNPLPSERIGFDEDTYYDESGRFVYGGELRLEGSFEVTEYISVRGGLNILAFADGVGRGVYGTDEALTMGGATFGFTINR